MAQEPTANQSQEKRVRLVRPSIVLLCGPAACGKSTFAQRHFRPTQVISSDWARGRVCDDERDQRYSAQAFALVRYLTELRLGLNRLCVVDSTALTPPHRREFLELARRYQVPCEVFLFDVPLEKCIERDRQRDRTVGSQVIERHYQAFGQTKAEIRQEGFDQVIEFVGDDLEKVRIEIIFRPIPQLPASPGRRGSGDSRPASHTWQQRSGRAPAAHEAAPASPPPPAPASAKPAAAPSGAGAPSAPAAAKPEARPAVSAPKPASASPQVRAPAPPGAPRVAPLEPPTASQGTEKTPSVKTTSQS